MPSAKVTVGSTPRRLALRCRRFLVQARVPPPEAHAEHTPSGPDPASALRSHRTRGRCSTTPKLSTSDGAGNKPTRGGFWYDTAAREHEPVSCVIRCETNIHRELHRSARIDGEVMIGQLLRGLRTVGLTFQTRRANGRVRDPSGSGGPDMSAQVAPSAPCFENGGPSDAIMHTNGADGSARVAWPGYRRPPCYTSVCDGLSCDPQTARCRRAPRRPLHK